MESRPQGEAALLNVRDEQPNGTTIAGGTIDKYFSEKSEKYLEENFEEIMCLEKWQTFSIIIAFLSYIAMFIMISIKMGLIAGPGGFMYMFLLIPSYIGVIATTIYYHAWLKEKDIFDNAYRPDEKSSGCSLGTALSFVCLYLAALSCLVYITLLSAKLDSLLIAQYNIIGIPFYIFIGVAIFFFVFMLPAFILEKLYFCMMVLGVYILGIFLTFLMLNLKLDGGLKQNAFIALFSPVIISIILHALYLINKIVQEFKENFTINLFHLVGIILILLGTIFIALNADQSMSSATYTPVILFLFALLCFFDYSQFVPKEDSKDYN
jgi:hypothetical protein